MLYRNELEVIGNIGKVKVESTNGRKLARVSVAVNSRKIDEATGEVKEYTDWVPFTFFGEQAVAFIEKFAKPGDHVCVNGKVSQRKYQQNGEDVWTIDVIGFRFTFVQPKGDNQSAGDELDDEIPH